jgi:hypothetical protein
MPLIRLQKRNGVSISFQCDLTDGEARQIILAAHEAHQNVGDFALKLARQRQALTELQSGWLKYLALEVSGQLRQRIGPGPWAWLLSEPHYQANGLQVTAPPNLQEQQQACRWVRVLYGHEWRYVGRIDQHGGFQFSKEICQLVTGEGRGAMALVFPDEEQQLQDEAKRLQYLATQKLEALKKLNHFSQPQP